MGGRSAVDGEASDANARHAESGALHILDGFIWKLDGSNSQTVSNFMLAGSRYRSGSTPASARDDRTVVLQEVPIGHCPPRFEVGMKR